MVLLEAIRRTPRLASGLSAFFHGFRLPFSLMLTTLRDSTLRGPYVRLVLVRTLIVAVIAFLGLRHYSLPKRHERRLIVDTSSADGGAGPPIHVDIPGVHVDLDPQKGQQEVRVLGKQVPLEDVEDDAGDVHFGPKKRLGPKRDPGPAERVPEGPLEIAWAWVLTIVGVVTFVEAVVVALSRRWDDWLSFHVSRFAGIRPEDETPKPPKVALDLRWLARKLKRRIRGYVVFGAGLPLLALLHLIPSVGAYVFSAIITVWGWYWLGVFSAAKSAHAWADEAVAPSPYVIRTFNEGVSKTWLSAPFHWYGRLWAWLTRGINPAAMTFDRYPAAFLGLALARALLAFPVLYLFARPVVPVASGRLCAESDPEQRFWA
jgi:hypothetical protein